MDGRDEQKMETTAVAVVSEEPAGTPWRVLKRDTGPSGGDYDPPHWADLGVIHGRYSYLLPDEDQIGALGGAGEYLLFRADNDSVRSVEIRAITRYETVDAEEES